MHLKLRDLESHMLSAHKVISTQVKVQLYVSV